MSDLGYWLVMAFMAVLVVVATGGVVAYAYFSQDRWGKPREIMDKVRDKAGDAPGTSSAEAETSDERDQVAA